MNSYYIMAQNTNIFLTVSGQYRDISNIFQPGTSSVVTKIYKNGTDIGTFFNLTAGIGRNANPTKIYLAGGTDMSSTFNKIITYLLSETALYAFSVRLVVPTYTGPVIRIRRSSDNVESDFYSDISQNWLTTGAFNTGTSYDSWISTNTGYVTTWYEQSGTGNHATQTNTANQPTFNYDIFNIGVVSFSSSGSGTWLTIPNLTTLSNTFLCNFYTLNATSTYNTLMCAAIGTDFGVRLSNQTLNGDISNNIDWYPSASGTKLNYVNNVSTVSVPLTTWNSAALSVQTPTTTVPIIITSNLTTSSASGLTVSGPTTVSTNTVYSFTLSGSSNGTCNVSFNANMNIQVLVVAGGGGGGIVGGGGGGAGGLIYNSSVAVTSGTSYAIQVGAGGAGAPYTADVFNKVNGSNGNNSKFDTLIAIGGGGGGSYNRNPIAPNSGGSGGGGSFNYVNPANGTTGQGNRGGYGYLYEAGGGGGGAGTVGRNAGGSGYNGYYGGNGGDGISYSITGSAVYYAGGGGGGTNFGLPSSGGNGGTGGSSVGGKGGDKSNTNGLNGVANTGGGGGGGGYGPGNGGKGGSGIVIISFPSTSISGYIPARLSVIGTDGNSRARGLNGYMSELMAHNTPLTASDITPFYTNRLL